MRAAAILFFVLVRTVCFAASPIPLESGQTVEGELKVPGQIDSYEFSGRTGDSVQIRMVSTDVFVQSQIELRSPDATVLETVPSRNYDRGARSSRISGGVELNATLVNNGKHVIICKDSGTEVGKYSVSLLVVEPSPTTGSRNEIARKSPEKTPPTQPRAGGEPIQKTENASVPAQAPPGVSTTPASSSTPRARGTDGEMFQLYPEDEQGFFSGVSSGKFLVGLGILLLVLVAGALTVYFLVRRRY